MSKRLFGLLFLILILSILSVFGWRWIHYRLTHSISNAVFVESDSFTNVAYKRVGGRIINLYKEEGDRVRKGEALAKLEDRDIRVKLEEVKRRIERLEKEREALKVKRRSLEEELREREGALRAKLEEVKKEIESLKVRIDQLRRDRRRFEDLYKKGVVPSRKLEEVETRLLSLEKKREALISSLGAIRHEIGIVKIKIKGLKELDLRIEALKKSIYALKERKEDLENMLSETVLRSPIDGYVVKRYVSVGEVVRQGQAVYAVYDPKDVYILVLLEETKLEGVKEGNRAYIEIDAYPEERFEGVVKEINRATAAKFALIPRDITAGEFTKVAQRIPVKIEITKGDKSLLRIGMGGEVAIEKTP